MCDDPHFLNVVTGERVPALNDIVEIAWPGPGWVLVLPSGYTFNQPEANSGD